MERTDPERYGATAFAAEPDERRGRATVAVRADHDAYLGLLRDTLGP
ncbi:hypothetical protein G5V59_07080 [Nocardioides sp. W3-2-3]|nr:hypothetical protein [Nocardioides convexus]